MFKAQKDDSAVAPATATAGTEFVQAVAAKARAIYPDHAGSREAYLREAVAVEIDRLRTVVVTQDKDDLVVGIGWPSRENPDKTEYFWER